MLSQAAREQAWCAAVGGTTIPTTRARPTATGMSQRTATITTVFGWWLRLPMFVCPFFWSHSCLHGCDGGVRTRARPFRKCAPATAVAPRRRERNSAGIVWSARRPARAGRHRASPAPGAYKRLGIAWLQNPLCPPFRLFEPTARHTWRGDLSHQPRDPCHSETCPGGQGRYRNVAGAG